tara:strand:+ start:188 stop:916 length:729 start_codon:yes stop_codon:yes gene_type:complete
MATSGTITFNPPIDDIIEEAYERTNIRGVRTGYQLKSARRSLNILFSEWANRGIQLWEIKQASVNLVQAQATYSTAANSTGYPTDISDVLEAWIRNNSSGTSADVSLTKIDRSQYAAIPNKAAQGTPSQYYVDRLVAPTVTLYTTPSSSFSSADTPTNFQLCFFYLARIQDVGAYTNTADVVYRFYPCMISGLAYYLSIKYSPDRTEGLRLLYEDELARALNEDSQGTSSFITPQTFYGDGV